MKPGAIAEYLRQNDLLTVHQYQCVTSFPFHNDANKYLLQLIKGKPREYLTGLKEALMKVKQDNLIDYLP